MMFFKILFKASLLGHFFFQVRRQPKPSHIPILSGKDVGDGELSTMLFLKCLFLSPWNLKTLLYPQIILFFLQKCCACTQGSTSGGFSWTLCLLWVTSFLSIKCHRVPCPQERQGRAGGVEDAVKVTRCISFCACLLFVETNAPLTL